MARPSSTRILPIFAIVAVVTLAVVLIVWLMGLRVARANDELLRSQRAQIQLAHVLEAVSDAETGQRGYILTGDERYLQTYTQGANSVPMQLEELSRAAEEGYLQKSDADQIRRSSLERIAWLARTLQIYRESGQAAAISEIRTDAGRRAMEEVRRVILRVEETQASRIQAARRLSSRATTVRTVSTIAGAVVMLSFLVWAYMRLARDIADRERAQAQLAEGRQRLEGIVASAMDAIISVDAKQNIVLFNKAAERVFKCSAEEAVGSSLDRFIPARYREVHREHMRRFGETGQTSRAMGSGAMNLAGLRADGEEFPIDASISQIDIGGQKIFTVILRDVTDRKRWEEQLAHNKTRLEGIVSSAMDAIISIDEQQNIVLFNAAAERVFKCAAAEAMGSPLDRFIPERYRAIHREHVRHFGETGETTRAMGTSHMSLSAVRSDGEEFPIDASISQVDVGGQKLYTAILRDITDRKRAEQELMNLHADLERRVKERTAELAAANRELEAFGYSVSHDLRAPLRHVTGFVELLEKHASATLDEKGKRYLKTIHEASRRMGNLIDDLLTLSRIGRATLTQVDVDLRELVDESIVQLTDETAGRNIQWEIGELPVVHGDPSLLRNVVMNLLTNALKYSRTRDPAIIEIDSRKEDNEVICFFRDNGVGFDMQFVDKLFGVFQRLHRPEEFEGTGIGLASVRRVIQKHGGRTWAEGAVNQGATVYFSLPLKR